MDNETRVSLLIDYIKALKEALDTANNMSVLHEELVQSILKAKNEIESLLLENISPPL